MSSTTWEFTDDRGSVIRAARRPERVVAYIRAGAALHEYGLTPAGIFGSGHDGEQADPVKAGGLPADVPYLGAGKTLDEEALGAAAPDLVVDVTYDDHFAYAVDEGVAAGLRVPVVALSVAGGTPLTSLVARFAALAEALGVPADPAAGDVLAEARTAVRTAAAGPGAPRVLVLSAAGTEQVHLARPGTWPELRHLAELGVDLVDPGPGPGLNWLTTDWEYAAGLGADLVLADARGNAVPPADLAGVPGWTRLTSGHPVLPWNPELAPAPRATARFLRDVAAALTD
ncbi:ABC transporter substrate-binding protein [Streptomyces sp. AM 3-1-1]|uniref:ABC transporter substrate-binding protein n=1 Tax=Streptomyces sp. AM 3-1-1 TaxID=3028711 RepID=UPI0023B9EACA|nr:ABC transporter substrate-binding protein [Streptomyces sp. AM 3-1-1]WEH26185.1 ABC transporter substrate-binding protein [Streptomyces sp. AM 3-1-1]